jgi:uncharacterized protein YbjT (DUF2867 family)
VSDGLVLVTGATGKTGRSLVARLEEAGVPYRAASRHTAVPFDWADTATWEPALAGAAAVYLIAPPGLSDPYARVIEFLEHASTETRRYVFLGIASLPAGELAHGRVHQWLKDHATDWAVLRPSAFMQNFSEGLFCASIVDEDTIYSNTGGGRVGFIDADDIARAAFHALTSADALNSDFVLTGDEALSFDEVAEIISATCGRTITHAGISDEEAATRLQQRGVPEVTAQLLAAGYGTIAQGAADYTTEDLRQLTGRAATTFRQFADAHAQAWRR